MSITLLFSIRKETYLLVCPYFSATNIGSDSLPAIDYEYFHCTV